MCRRLQNRAAYRGLTEYINAWFRGTRCNEVATSARVVVLGSARACAGRRLINRRARAVPGSTPCARQSLCQLINRRFAVYVASDVLNRKFLTILITDECYRIRQVWGLSMISISVNA